MGQGLNFTYQDVQSMDLDEFQDYQDILDEIIEADNKANTKSG